MVAADGPAGLPPPIRVVGKLIVKGKFDFKSVRGQGGNWEAEWAGEGGMGGEQGGWEGEIWTSQII